MCTRDFGVRGCESCLCWVVWEGEPLDAERGSEQDFVGGGRRDF